ncbi:MAG: VWA domain-containing protein [Dehalococcoidia bacterium]
MQFANPYLLWLLALVPLLALWQWRRQRRERPPSLPLSTLAPLQEVRPSWRVRLRPALFVLRLAAVALVVVAAARPQQGRVEETIEAEGVDIALALDVSRSMVDSRLGERSSLEVAKEVASEFVLGLKNDRVGLVVFQGDSRLLSPLTLDREAVAEMIRRTVNGILPEGTAIGLAMSDAVNLVRESRAKSRAIILVTDGENNQHDIEPLAAARIAEALKVRVYTVGVIGTSPSVPFTPRRQQISVDEEALKEIARLTDARYYRATDADTLSDIYQNIGQLEKSRVGEERFAAYDELAAYFLGPAFGLLLLEVGLASTVLRRAP